MSDLAKLIERLTAIAQDVDSTLEAARALQAAQLAHIEEQRESEVAEHTFPEHDLIDTATAAIRFRKAPDTIRHWCEHEGMGVMRGKRWRVSVSRLKARLGY